MKLALLYLLGLSVLFVVCCTKIRNTESRPEGSVSAHSGLSSLTVLDTFFAKGADISWLTEMEASGKKFKSSSGNDSDCLKILKSKGINAVRLRVFVNPSDGYCNKQDVIAKAIRAKNLGMKILIDFHYSDSFADPGVQTKPGWWQGLSFTALNSALWTHTVAMLDSLKNHGITPAWVQVGNETNNGMVWPDGRADTLMANYTALVKTGYNAVKYVDSSIKVIVHLGGGQNIGNFKWIFDSLAAHNANWDAIGMSVYPADSNFNSINAKVLKNMDTLYARYGKPIIICEAGMGAFYDSDCKTFLQNLMTNNASLGKGIGLGVFYWEPECYGGWKNYTKGAFDPNGKPTVAMDAFLQSY